MKLVIETRKKLDDEGNWIEEKVYVIDGEEVHQKVAEEVFPDGDSSEVGIGILGVKNCNAWPIYSEGAGVHPDQRKEAEEHARTVGVPTAFTKDGRAVFTSLNHQREFLKAHFLMNRDDNAGGQSRTVRKPTPNREDYV